MTETESQKQTMESPGASSILNEIAAADASSTASPRRARFTWGKFISVLLVLAAITIFATGTFLYTTNKAFANLGKVTGENQGDILGGLFKSFTKPEAKIAGQDEGRTNILLVGVDSSGGLADSIQILSYFYETKEFVSYSIPRDLKVSAGGGVSKINETYVYAEQLKERGGPERFKDIIESEWGVHIHYWAQVDFDGVKEFVDQVGGVTIDAPNSFTDCEFPRRDYSGNLPCQGFQAGVQNMDGETALIYARSRHGNNGEGSDFKRSLRQQIVVEALLKKMKDDAGKSKFNFEKINEYLDTLGKNVRISLKSTELKTFYDVFFKQLAASQGQIKKVNLMVDDKLFSAVNENGYYIVYADGSYPGNSANSKSREKVRALLSSSGSSASGPVNFADVSVIALANNADSMPSIVKQLKTSGLNFCDLCYDNSYKKAKSSSAETVTVYISDKKIRAAFEKQYKDKFSFAYTIADQLPPERVLTENNQGTDIILWIE
jgi:LCP family protein required for cell wall assembly